MIAKEVSMRSAHKSNFADLAAYISDTQSKGERVGYVAATNCQSDDPRVAVLEVLNTQAQNKRATSDKTYHLIVSFPGGEQPSETTLRAIEARLCDALGYGEHQRVSAVHHDTDNLHMHIAVNKIHPTRYTLHDPYRSQKTLANLCEGLERECGLQIDNHQARKNGSENRAGDMERHAGVESLLGWIKRECAEQLTGAQSWAELHEALHRNGLALRERGNGLVITAGEDLAVKASSVARELSRPALEKRLGPFAPAPQQAPDVAPSEQTRPRVRYKPTPIRSRVDTSALYARYAIDMQSRTAQRGARLEEAVGRKNDGIEAAKRSGRFKRAAIKLLEGRSLAKTALYGVAGRELRNDIQQIGAQYMRERKEIYSNCARMAWADWLRAQATAGDQEALRALRARESAQGLKGNTLTGRGPRRKHDGPAPRQDSVTKKGTIIYRAGDTAVRDDGARLSVSRGATQSGLEAALRLASQRYGSRLAVNGSSAFKDQIASAAAAARLDITFDDEALERRRQHLVQTAAAAHDLPGRVKGSTASVSGAASLRPRAAGSGRGTGRGGHRR